MARGELGMFQLPMMAEQGVHACCRPGAGRVHPRGGAEVQGRLGMLQLPMMAEQGVHACCRPGAGRVVAPRFDTCIKAVHRHVAGVAGSAPPRGM